MSTCLAGSLGTGKEGGKKKGSERETPNCEACLDGWNLAPQHRTKYVFFVYLRYTVSNHNVLGLGRSFPQEVRRRPSTHNFCYFSFNWLVSTVIFFLCHRFKSFILCFGFSHISFSVTFYSPFFSRGHSCFSAHRSVYEVQIQSYKQLLFLFFLKRSIDSFKFEDSSKHFWCSKLTFFLPRRNYGSSWSVLFRQDYLKEGWLSPRCTFAQNFFSKIFNCSRGEWTSVTKASVLALPGVSWIVFFTHRTRTSNWNTVK